MVNRARLLLGVAFAALTGSALADDLVISTERKTPVSTSSAANGTPGNILVQQGISIFISTPGPVVTIDSANSVTNTGVIQSLAGTGGIGVHILSGSGGTLTNEGFSRGFIVSRPASSDPLAGADNIGVLLDGASTFAGAIDLQVGSAITVIGKNSTGIAIRSSITGNLIAGSTINVVGENATGLSVLAPVGGAITMGGGISVRGTFNFSFDKVDPFAGSAVVIGANVAKGILNIGPDGQNVPPESKLFGSGLAPTLVIAASAGGNVSDITIGSLVGEPISSTFSFANRGVLEASENDTGVSTIAGRIGESGTATRTTTLSGGFYNRGSILSTAQSDNSFSTGVAAMTTNATGLIIGNGATVSDFTYANTAGTGSTVSSVVFDAGASDTNDFYNGLTVTVNGEKRQITDYDGATRTATIGAYNGSSATFSAAPVAADAFLVQRNVALLNEGLIQATMTGTATGTVTAILVTGPSAGTPLTAGNHGTLPSLINTGTITAAATTINPAVSGLAAYAIRDESGTLTSLTNLGLIATNVSLLPDFSQQGVAVDISRSAAAETIINSGSILGDVRFGSAGMIGAVAGNQLSIEGVSALVSGSVGSAGAGTLDIHISEAGAGGTLHTANTRATTLTVGNKGAVNFALNRTTGIAPLVSATGITNFAANTTMGLRPTTFLQDNTALTLIGGGGTVHMENPSVTTALTVPVLFKATIACDGGPCTQTTPTDFNALTLTLTRKNAAELGFTGNNARIYEPLVDVALADDTYGSTLIGITDTAQLQTAISSAVPDIAGGVRALSVALTDQGTGVVAARQRALMTAPAGTREDLHFWAQEFYSYVSENRSTTGNGFGGAGQGLVLGAEWGSSRARYGVGYTFFSSQETERAPRDTKTNGDWNLVSAYAGWRFGDVFLAPQASAGAGDFASRRNVVTGTSLRATSAQWSSYLAAGGVTAGYIVDVGGFQLIPEIAVDGLWLNESAYNERGGGAMNLHLKSQTQKSVRTFAGVLGQGAFAYEGGNFVPQLLAGWSREFMTTPATIDGTFEAAPGSPFHLVGPTVDSNRVIGGMSFAYVLRNWAAGVNIDAAKGERTMSSSATVSLSSRF